MKNNNIKYLLCLLFFIVLAVITFRCVWPADHIFSASDINAGGLAFRKGHMPEYFTGYFSSTTVMGSASHGFRFFELLLVFLPLTVFANVFYGFILILGSASLIWFLRLWGRSWMASCFGALIGFWFNSIILASTGHAYKMEVLAFSVLGLCLIEKSVRAGSFRKTAGFSLLAGLSLGIMMIEQQDVALLAGLFVGPYAVFRVMLAHGKAVRRWLCMLVPMGIVAFLLSGATVVKSYERNIAGAAQVQGDAPEKWSYVTQWSMVPAEWPDLVAPGWGGWSTGNPEGPYWGKIGRDANWESTGQGFQNFKLDSIYLGIVPFLLGAFGLAAALKNRKSEEGAAILFWSIAGLLGFWLAFGKYSILYKLFYQLPMVGNIRAPIKFLDNFQICLGIVAAYGLDRLLINGKAEKGAKALWVGSSVCAGLLLLAGLRLLAFPASPTAGFAEMGFASYAETMLNNMTNAWFHSALLTLLCAALVFMIWKGVKQAKWAGVVLVAVLAVDSLALTSHYFRAESIASMKKENPVLSFLKENQGNERIFMVDQNGIYNRWRVIDGAFYGLNFFNIWQMPRMPAEYKEFLGTVGRNNIRMWELSSVKYITAPASILQQFSQNPKLAKLFTPVMNYQIPTAQGMRPDVLLEFNSHIPRFALYQNWRSEPLEIQCVVLASQKHDPHSILLVDPVADLASAEGNGGLQGFEAKVTSSKAEVVVKTVRPGILRFAQRHQSGWTVYVDGKEAKLLRVDYLCMGVQVPPGEHTIEFRCPSHLIQVLFTSLVFIASLCAAVLLLRAGSRKG